jgi:Tfp pilus assembly protein PilF
LFGRKRPYDRARLLAEAGRAQRRRRATRAVALYREILAADPGDVTVHRRLAPLLARLRQADEAWRSFRRAAESLAAAGFVERALGVYRDAAHHLPRESAAWLAIAELEVARGRRADAVAALAAGRAHLRARRSRADARRLLERAHEIDPAHVAIGLDLAGLLARTGERPRARELLRALERGQHGRALRRVRARQLLLFPSVRSVWRWLRA